MRCRIDIWVKEQKKRRKDKPLEYWSMAAASERNTFRNPELNRRMIEAASKAERVLLYTTGFQFSVPTAFWVLAGCKHRLKLHHDPAVARFFEELDLQVRNVTAAVHLSEDVAGITPHPLPLLTA